MKMKTIIIPSLKISLAVAMAIFLANLLHLEYAISAGIVAVLTIQPTKRETLQIALGRLAAFCVALCIAFFSYSLLGFTQIAFLLYMTMYVFVCYLKNWNAAITINSVLVSHFLAYESMSFSHILNEVQIFSIGVLVGIFVNLHLHKKEEYMEKLKNQTDEQIVDILSKMGRKVRGLAEDEYTDTCFKELEHIIREAKNIAEENFNNQLFTKDKSDLDYIAMRHKQYTVLYNMYKITKRIETTPATAGKIADFFDEMASVFHKDNDGKRLMSQFQEMDAYMKKKTLPSERQEFEDRARLFVLMRNIEEFIEIKMIFLEMEV